MRLIFRERRVVDLRDLRFIPNNGDTLLMVGVYILKHRDRYLRNVSNRETKRWEGEYLELSE